MVPSSRKGETVEFNLFPYKVKCHESWHQLFLNMRTREVWERLDDIHGQIFDSDNNFMTRSWLSVCELPSKTDLENQLAKAYRVENLQDCWIRAFGGWEVVRARMFMKYMMLFMIFGVDMADLNKLLDNGHLSGFFDKFPVENERKWAFEICFGKNADWQTIKAKIAKITRRSP